MTIQIFVQILLYNQIYQDYCHKNGTQPHFVSTDRGVKGFWVGSPLAKYIVIYFHGKQTSIDPYQAKLIIVIRWTFRDGCNWALSILLAKNPGNSRRCRY